MIGVAQTFGQAFIAWVPVLVLNVGKYAPRFHLGFSVMSGISVLQFAMIFVLRFFVNRQTEQEKLQKHHAIDSSITGKRNNIYETRPKVSDEGDGVESLKDPAHITEVRDKHWQQ